MRRALLLFLFLIPMSAAFGQYITLHHLMGFHSLNDSVIYRQLKQVGWRYYGVQYDILRKPRMYALEGNSRTQGAQLYLFGYRKKPLCKVELVSNDVAGFNAIIRDSLSAYGFQPEMDVNTPDEEGLKITTSASFVNKDAATPVHALILYFEERHKPRVSLTIYAED